jgi:hypothetical protein
VIQSDKAFAPILTKLKGQYEEVISMVSKSANQGANPQSAKIQVQSAKKTDNSTELESQLKL